MTILTPEQKKEMLKKQYSPNDTEVELCTEAFSSERMRLVADHPFYGIILMSLKVFAAGVECPTACVNYKNMKLHAIEPGRLITPEGEPFEGLTFHRLKPMARRTVLAHELMHVILEHLDIPGTFNHDIANIAQDAIINRILSQDPSFDLDTLPEGCVKPIKSGNTYVGFTYGAGKHKQTYEIDNFGELDWIPVYHYLMDKVQNQCKGLPLAQQAQAIKDICREIGSKNPMNGDVDYEETGNTSPEFDQDKMKMQATILNAYENAKHAGNIPGEISEMIEGLTRGRIRWIDRLRRLLRTEINRNDFSWKPNSRRGHLGRDGHPAFFPRIESEAIGAVWLVLDTSGSMSDEDLKDGLSEFRSLRQQVPFDLYFLSVDYTAYEVKHFSKHEEPNWDEIRTKYVTGRGGTSFRPAFEAVEAWRKKGNQKPAMLAYFTDLYGDWPEKAPDYPVFWIVTESGWEDANPWGEKIIMKDEVY